MRTGARIGTLAAFAALVVFVAGVSVGVSYAGHSGIQWNNQLSWQPIATLIGAVLNCFTVALVAWAITTRLQKRQSDQAFERGLLAEFARAALSSATRIHERVLDCRKRNVFMEEDRQAFVSLFTGLGQDIQLIHDALEALNIIVPAVDAAQQRRGQYKDLLTDRAPGEPISQDGEHAAYVKHRELRKDLIQIIIEAGRN